MPTRDELTARYRELPDDEIHELALSGPDAFTAEAWRALNDEIRRRGLRVTPPAPRAPSFLSGLKRTVESLPHKPLDELVRDPEVQRIAAAHFDAATAGLARAAAPLADPETYRRVGRFGWLSATLVVRRVMSSAGVALAVAITLSMLAALGGRNIEITDILIYFIQTWGPLFVISLAREWSRRTREPQLVANHSE